MGDVRTAVRLREEFSEELEKSVGEPRLPVREADVETLQRLNGLLADDRFDETYKCDMILQKCIEEELRVRDEIAGESGQAEL